MNEAAQHNARLDEHAETLMRRLIGKNKDAIQAELVIDAVEHLDAADAGAYIRDYSVTVYALSHATTLLQHAFKTIEALEAEQPLWRESA